MADFPLHPVRSERQCIGQGVLVDPGNQPVRLRRSAGVVILDTTDDCLRLARASAAGQICSATNVGAKTIPCPSPDH